MMSSTAIARPSKFLGTAGDWELRSRVEAGAGLHTSFASCRTARAFLLTAMFWLTGEQEGQPVVLEEQLEKSFLATRPIFFKSESLPAQQAEPRETLLQALLRPLQFHK